MTLGRRPAFRSLLGWDSGRHAIASSVPLNNKMHQACVMCHANFTPELFENNPGQWVGALVVGVPIRSGREH